MKSSPCFKPKPSSISGSTASTPTPPTEERLRFWFQGGDAVDREIGVRFGDALPRAAAGKFNGWAATPRGRLALIVLLDQFSRNLYRGTERAFANDARALTLAREGIEQGHDQALEAVERLFFYLPFEHSEQIEDQQTSVRLYEELVRDAPHLRGALDEAINHRDLIERFGRFPHRNRALGRDATAEERRYLDETGKTYGQG